MHDGGRPVLEVQGLKTVFRVRGGEIHAVNNVSFDLKPGELLGVVGESGSGKSVTMMSLLGLLPSPPAEVRDGKVLLDGQDLLKADEDTLREVRGGKVGFIFQDPMTSLNPVFTVGYQIMEPLRKHMGMDKKAAKKRAVELLELVGIPGAEQRLSDYPHQFSGGMRQRVMIAIALAAEPDLLVADEPTTALDVTVQKYILEGREGELLEIIKNSHHEGMLDFTSSLVGLVESEYVHQNVALQATPKPEELKMRLKGIR